MKPRVYLAGKIAENCWRHLLVPNLREHTWADGPVDAGKFIYTGPFFIGCDHACAHGPAQHGMLNSCCRPSHTRQQIYKLNMAALATSDLIFAYITAYDCIGSIFEIGWAVSRGKRLVVTYAPEINHREFWFAAIKAAARYNNVTPGELPLILRREAMRTNANPNLGSMESGCTSPALGVAHG